MGWSRDVAAAGGGSARSRFGLWGVLTGCVLVAVLSFAGSANAASRRFTVVNGSGFGVPGYALMFEGPKIGRWGWPIGFEGRPPDYSVLEPKKTQEFELTSPAHEAILRYHIQGVPRDIVVEYEIRTISGPKSLCRFVDYERDRDPPYLVGASLHEGDRHFYCRGGEQRLTFDGFVGGAARDVQAIDQPARAGVDER